MTSQVCNSCCARESFVSFCSICFNIHCLRKCEMSYY